MNDIRYRKHIFTENMFLGKTYVIIYIQEHFVPESLKEENRMYFTVKQLVYYYNIKVSDTVD